MIAQCPFCLKVHKLYKNGKIVRHGFFSSSADCWGSRVSPSIDARRVIDSVLAAKMETYTRVFGHAPEKMNELIKDATDYVSSVKKLWARAAQ